MRRGQTDAYLAFPEITAQLGYNPARFLVPTDNERDELSWAKRVKAFIRGMDVETIRAWQTVEVALAQGANGGPRREVIKWLNRRKADLDGTASQPDDLAVTRNRSDAALEEETVGSTETQVEPDTSPSVTETSPPTAPEIAADGGATPDEPSCPACHSELKREEIAGKTGYWCPQCQDVRKPATTEAVPA